MLPYGSLWKLDRMINSNTANSHGPKKAPLSGREHRKLMRRRWIAYIFIGIFVSSFFMFPYYLTQLHLLEHRLELERKGVLTPTNSTEETLRLVLAIREIKRKIGETTPVQVPEWEEWLYFRPLQPLSRERVYQNLYETSNDTAWTVVSAEGDVHPTEQQWKSYEDFPVFPSLFDKSLATPVCFGVVHDMPIPSRSAGWRLSYLSTNATHTTLDARLMGIVGFVVDLAASRFSNNPPNRVRFVPCDATLEGATYGTCVCRGRADHIYAVRVNTRELAAETKSCRSHCGR